MTEPTEVSFGEQLKTDAHKEVHGPASGRVAMVLRIISTTALVLAVSAAVILVTLRLIRCFQPNLIPWTLKSAYPLILIGIAFASLQFASPRTRKQILMGVIVSAAFILWGTEQCLSNQAMVSLIDDIVVFLFVLDLSIVIYSHLKSGAHRTSKELPFDEPGE